MYTKSQNRTWTAIVISFALLFGGAVVATALETEETAAEEAEQVTLEGQLTKTDLGDYMLIEPSSGEAIELTCEDGSVDFDAHVETTVEVTGSWNEAEDGSKTFVVTSIAPVEKR